MVSRRGGIKSTDEPIGGRTNAIEDLARRRTLGTGEIRSGIPPKTTIASFLVKDRG